VTKKVAALPMPRRRFLSVSTGLLAGSVTSSLFRGIPALATTTPVIPEKTVRLSAAPYADHCWVVLAGRQGYLKDVGITLSPPDPRVILEQQAIPQLENGEIDIATMYLGNITTAIDKISNIKPFFVQSYWAGNTILVSPTSGYKTVDDFIAQGQSWKDAAKSAMMQLKGQEIVVPPNPSTEPWLNLAYSFAGLTLDDSSYIALEDPKAVQLAISGRAKAAAPGGASQIYQLQYQAGWKSLMSTKQMLKYVTAGPGSEINNVLNYDCLVGTQAFLDGNKDTVMRLCSAFYRTIDYMFGPQQTDALTKYKPFINANSGSNLDASALKFIFEVLDPFFPWSEQHKLWADPKYALFYENVYKFQLNAYKKAGTIANRDYDLNSFFAAKSIWENMNALKLKADDTIAKIKSSGTVATERQVLIDTALKHYKGYNFLDANRFFEAALA
jgi:ABC-type nitrate/sulfonate/bicarbonate transport system substrate-binding protein